ncbi:uncharacterized protein LOC108150089, partial [Drosophila elegans]|uniref:uncharacterized protein LOC108150089 n=1 Tax=Drosophila elegans TaxID=30023 RepID=UPI0007E78831
LQNVSKFEFTNVQCTSLDKQFDEFEHCYLKSVNRTYKYVYMKVNLFKTPVKKIKINLSLQKRFNGYRPFLFNITVDACRLLLNPSANPTFNYFYGFLGNHTNVNHPCPFDHDLIFDKITTNLISHRMSKILPFPEGDYLMEVNWFAYDINRAITKFYGTLS